MVVFTCNACGASLKKNQVEKHYQNECRNCEILSCIDCGRDFYGDEYASHTKCISEAEKYQGSLYKESGKGGTGKGERKQQAWLEKVKQSVASSSFNPRVARLLERIAEYPNIPRKKAKFENFVKNSCNVRDQKTLSQLWDIFSGATQQQVVGPKSAPQQKQDGGCSTTDGSPHLLNSLETEESEKQPNDCCEKKKKKKHKERGELPVEQNQDATLEWTGDAGTKNHSRDSGDPPLNPPKHKKKKKHRNEDQQDSSERTTQNDAYEEDVSGTSVTLTVIKKRKRKHRHKDVEENDVDAVGEGALQRASETKAKQSDGAEGHKLPRMIGMDEKDQEIVVLTVGGHSSRKQKHKAMEETGRDSGPLCVVPDNCNKESEDSGDPTQSVAKRLKVDGSSLGVYKAKKSKHKHRRKP